VLKSYKPETLQLTQVDKAATLLAKAFSNDPAMAYAVPDEASRVSRLIPFFKVSLLYGMVCGTVQATPDVQGVAIWFSPHPKKLALADSLKSGLLAQGIKSVFRLKLREIQRFVTMEIYTQEMRRRFAPEPHWYLQILGIDPALQGRGYARALLQPMLDKARSEGYACYLETMKETNVAIYQKLGFRLAGKGIVPKGGPDVWFMVADA
jgi:ribosomal protein S18 acetylase RimI-like enzyme